MDRYDVAIIGGGIIGVSTAFWLSRKGVRNVVVIEKDMTLARSSTALSVASIRHQFTTEVNVKISQFGTEFIAQIGDYVGGELTPNLNFVSNGYLFLSGTEESAVHMKAAVEMQRRLGAATRLLDRASISQMFGFLNVEDVLCGSFGPDKEGWFDQIALHEALRRDCQRMGVFFVQDQVRSADFERDSGWSLGLAQSDSVNSHIVVNAAGTAANDVMQMLGATLPVEPRKRTVFVADFPDADIPNAPLIVDHTGFYVRPEGRFWLCARVPENDQRADPGDFEPDWSEFETAVWPGLAHRSSVFERGKLKSAWAGHYAYNCLDQNAIVGAWPTLSRVYVANGFSGHGLQQAPAVGRGLSELITEGRYTTLDLNDLGPTRVIEGKPFKENAIV